MLKYRIALVNVFWHDQDINTRFFNSVDEQKTYFNNLTGGNFSPLLNFNMGNNVETSIIYTDTTGKSIEELLSTNYAVIEKVNENNEVINTRYYFAYPQQDSGRQLRVILSLDDIQTNYFKHKNNISQCLIKRACLNRWVKNEDNTFSFNGNIDSNLFLTEDFKSLSKRLTRRTTLNIHPDQIEESNFNKWLDNNVIGWIYLYLTQGEKAIKNKSNEDVNYNIKAINYSPKEVTTIGENDLMNKIKGCLSVLCYPVYKNSVNDQDYSTIQVKNGDVYLNINELGLQKFLELNKNYSYVYAIKYSLMPPFINKEYNSNEYEIAGVNNLRLIGGSEDPILFNSGIPGLKAFNFGNNNGLFYITQQFEDFLLTNEYESNKKLTFTKEEIIQGNNDFNLNPKLLSQEFFELNIELGGQKFVYDYQKLNKQKIKLKVTEALTPDISRMYLRVNDTNGIYIKECEDNLTGLVYSNDNSLMVDNDQLSAMLANNKNFWIQSNVNVLGDIGIGFLGAMVGTGDPISSGIVGVASGIKSIINRNLNIDNLRNAPNTVKNANGNVVFNNLINSFKPHIEEYDLIDQDKKVINDYLVKYGYTLNLIDNIGNYDNIRINFNYIEAEVETINAPLSNIEKKRLIEKLKSVRFWNTDTINYDIENYERELLNG